MPLSKFLMSLSQIILICNWLLEGNLKNKFASFFKNKPALILSSLLLLHFIGLLYTSDYAYASKDIRIKFPLFILPLFLSTSWPLSQKIVNLILKFFIGGILVATGITSLVLVDVIHRNIADVRNASLFISHIRFALLIDVAFFCCIYFIKNTASLSYKIMWGTVSVWLIVFLILLESMTGLSILTFILFVLALYLIFKSEVKIIRYGLIVIIVGFCFFIGNMALRVIKQNSIPDEVVNYDTLQTHTAHGGVYINSSTDKSTENGHLVWIYFCMDELESAWNKRSVIKFDGEDAKGNAVRFTLIRFLASKGLRKDADAVDRLTDEEIKCIERGMPNVNYRTISGIEVRINEVLWEINLYKMRGDVNFHSITQRYAYWQAALDIVSENKLIGVGTGDVQKAFDAEYEKTNSNLLKELRCRSHNQYLTIGVAFGILGMIWFLFTLIYPMVSLNKTRDLLYVSFIIIAMISFLTEDTLESQAGVTFYAFLNAFFLFVHNNKAGTEEINFSSLNEKPLLWRKFH